MSDHSHPDRSGYASDRSLPPSPSSHEDAGRARKAAEALFAPKRPLADDTKPESAGTTQPGQRKPRILSVVREQQPEKAHVEAAKPSRQRKIRKPRKRVPVSHVARLRTWVKYGMTVHQASDMYGVSVTEIERILQKA